MSSPDLRPVPAGAEDLAPFVWQRWEQVCSRWRRLAPGTRPDVLETCPAARGAARAARRDGEALVAVRRSRRRPRWWSTTACLGERVVGFGPAGRDDWFVSHGDSTTRHGRRRARHSRGTTGRRTPEPEVAERSRRGRRRGRRGRAACSRQSAEPALTVTAVPDELRAEASAAGERQGRRGRPWTLRSPASSAAAAPDARHG